MSPAIFALLYPARPFSASAAAHPRRRAGRVGRIVLHRRPGTFLTPLPPFPGAGRGVRDPPPWTGTPAPLPAPGKGLGVRNAPAPHSGPPDAWAKQDTAGEPLLNRLGCCKGGRQRIPSLECRKRGNAGLRPRALLPPRHQPP